MRRVCLAHNLLPDAERQAFHALVIAGRSLEDVARATDTPAVEVARRARRGLEVVLAAALQHAPAGESAPRVALTPDVAPNGPVGEADAAASVHESVPESDLPRPEDSDRAR
jgi:hypothetical protein